MHFVDWPNWWTGTFSTRYVPMTYESYNSAFNTRAVLPTRQASKFLSPLNDSICRLDSLLFLADYHFLHSYDSTQLHGVPCQQDKPSPLNEMQMSTRQFTLSGGQALSPLVRLVPLDYHYTESLANKTSQKISKSP